MLDLALKFVPVGGGNVVCSSKIMSIVPTGTSVAEKLLSQAKKTNRYVALTNGRKCRSLILMDSGLLIGSRLRTETLFKRLEDKPELAETQYKEDTKPATYNFLEDEMDIADEEEGVEEDDSAFYSEDDTDEEFKGE